MYCYVPGCPNGNLVSKEGKKARRIVQIFFSAPEDETLFKAWQAAVPKSDHVFSREDKLCEFHFQKSEVVLYIETKLPNGNVRRLPASEPKLKAGTIPSIFPPVDSLGTRVDGDRTERQGKPILESEKPAFKRKFNVLDNSEKPHSVQQGERPRGRPRKYPPGTQNTPSSAEKRRKLAQVEPIVKKETDAYDLELSSESEKQNISKEVDENEIPTSMEPVPCSIRLVPLESLLENKPKQPSVKASVGPSGKQRKRIVNDFDKDRSGVLSSKKPKPTPRKDFLTPNPYKRVYDTHRSGITPTGRRIKKRLLDISDDPLSKELQLLMKGSQHRGRKAIKRDLDEISSELEKIVSDISDEREESGIDNYHEDISSGKSIGSNSFEDTSNDYSENIPDDIDSEILESITIKSDPDEEDQKDSLKELCAALENSNEAQPSDVSPKKTYSEGENNTWASVRHNISEDIQKLRDALTSDDEGRDDETQSAKKESELTVEDGVEPVIPVEVKPVENTEAEKQTAEVSKDVVPASSGKNDGEENNDEVAAAPSSSEDKSTEEISGEAVPAPSEISEKEAEEVSDKAVPAPPPPEQKDAERVSDEAVPSTSKEGIEESENRASHVEEQKGAEEVSTEAVPASDTPALTEEKDKDGQVNDKAVPATSEKKDAERVCDEAVPSTSKDEDPEEVSDEKVPATSEKEPEEESDRNLTASHVEEQSKEDNEAASETDSAEKGETSGEVINDSAPNLVEQSELHEKEGKQEESKMAEERELDEKEGKQEESKLAEEKKDEENEAASEGKQKDVSYKTDVDVEKEVADKEAPSDQNENIDIEGSSNMTEQREVVEDTNDEEDNSDVIEKDVETSASCNEPRITQVISLSDALSEGDEPSENTEENKVIEIDNFSEANEEDNDIEEHGRQTPDVHDDSGLKSTPDAEVYDISSDSDADPTWMPDAEAIAVSDDDDTDPGSVHDDDGEKGSKETDSLHGKENEAEKGNEEKLTKVKDGKENEKKFAKKNEATDSTTGKGRRRRTVQKRGRKKGTSSSATLVPATQPVNLLTSETIQEILKQIKLPLTTPVTLKIAPLVTSPDGKLIIDEKILTPATNLRKIAPRTADSSSKIKAEEYISKVLSSKQNKTKTIISSEKCKRSEGLLGLKMFEGLGKIKRAFDFSTFLSDAEDDIQFKKFCYLVKECFSAVQDSKNAKTNIGKLTINITHKSIQNSPEFNTDSTNSPNSKVVNSENDEAEVFECMTVDSNVEVQFGHRSFNEKYKYAA